MALRRPLDGERAARPPPRPAGAAGSRRAGSRTGLRSDSCCARGRGPPALLRPRGPFKPEARAQWSPDGPLLPCSPLRSCSFWHFISKIFSYTPANSRLPSAFICPVSVPVPSRPLIRLRPARDSRFCQDSVRASWHFVKRRSEAASIRRLPVSGGSVPPPPRRPMGFPAYPVFLRFGAAASA